MLIVQGTPDQIVITYRMMFFLQTKLRQHCYEGERKCSKKSSYYFLWQ